MQQKIIIFSRQLSGQSCIAVFEGELKIEKLNPFVRDRGTKVVCNAGGVNPEGCAEAMAKAAEKAGVKDLKIAAIGGDQVLVFQKVSRIYSCIFNMHTHSSTIGK